MVAIALLLRKRIQLPPQSSDFILVPAYQAGLVHNLIAPGCNLDLLGTRGKLECVVCLLCLAGCWCDCAHNSNAGAGARQGALHGSHHHRCCNASHDMFDLQV